MDNAVRARKCADSNSKMKPELSPRRFPEPPDLCMQQPTDDELHANQPNELLPESVHTFRAVVHDYPKNAQHGSNRWLKLCNSNSKHSPHDQYLFEVSSLGYAAAAAWKVPDNACGHPGGFADMDRAVVRRLRARHQLRPADVPDRAEEVQVAGQARPVPDGLRLRHVHDLLPAVDIRAVHVHR